MAESTPKITSFFERYLTVWVGLCIVGGVVLGGFLLGVGWLPVSWQPS